MKLLHKEYSKISPSYISDGDDNLLSYESLQQLRGNFVNLTLFLYLKSTTLTFVLTSLVIFC